MAAAEPPRGSLEHQTHCLRSPRSPPERCRWTRAPVRSRQGQRAHLGARPTQRDLPRMNRPRRWTRARAETFHRHSGYLQWEALDPSRCHLARPRTGLRPLLRAL